MVNKVSFSEIAIHKNLIVSESFFKWNKKLNQNKWFLGDRLVEYFDIISGFAFKSTDYTEEGISVMRIGDILKDGTLDTDNMNSLPDDFFEFYNKYLVVENDIAIAMTGATIGKTTHISTFSNPILLNQRVGLLRLKKDIKLNTKFIQLLLRNELFQIQILINSMGKSQPNISPFDILDLKIPRLTLKIQNDIISKIQPIDTEITHLKNSKLKPLDIINKVFGEEFGFDWEEFEKLKRQKKYSSSLNEFANNIDCRMGLKFHNLAGKYLHSFLISNTTKKVKDFIDEPIVLGKSVSPSDYDEEGEYFYIAMSNIKTYAFDPEDCKKVSEEYSKSNLNKTVQKGDILLARSGEGTIGKVALIEDEDLNAIFADFTQRIRLTNYNTLFAYYFFRSEFFQYLVYTHKKGLGNNTNIFPSQIREFPIPDWKENKQTKIVLKIKNQIDAQNIIDQQIEVKQLQINAIIENAIKA